MEIRIADIGELGAAARRFVEETRKCRVFAFYGAMGAGKTTFIRAVCECLSVEGPVTSPTFAIVNEYTSLATGNAVYHFDFYRVGSLEEARDIGCEEYLYSGNACFIEWPETIEGILPEGTLRVRIEESGDGSRLVSF